MKYERKDSRHYKGKSLKQDLTNAKDLAIKLFERR